jgi:DNA mismatch repair protein MutS
MSFTTDKQTLEDLNIFGRRGGDSIYGIFNRTFTRGGAEILEQMFRYPLSDRDAINNRSAIIRYFASTPGVFPFESASFDAIEQYLANTDERTRLSPEDNTLGRKLSSLVAADNVYKMIHKGVTALINVMTGLQGFLRANVPAASTPYRSEMLSMTDILSGVEFVSLLSQKPGGKLPYGEVAGYDALLRFRHREKIRKMLQHIYSLDVYLSVAKVARERNLVFPTALPGGDQTLELEGVYHLQLAKPIPNTIHMTPDQNIIFLTGANMAGKSTLMKSLGVAVFLAHMGFPVPASRMTFSIRDAIYTTINLSDNLNVGASHFYAEVLRIRKVAKEVSAGKNLFIIFDELFRGTNVKDAYEATIAIMSAFAQRENGQFIVSTHIIEAGEVLKEKAGNISFLYLPTRMEKHVPVYTYTLEKGITDDRHGMIIIRNEGILDILTGAKTKTASS